jgi:hypothetical protein
VHRYSSHANRDSAGRAFFRLRSAWRSDVATMIILLASQLPATWRGSHGDGIPGTFLAIKEECSKTCWWTGQFVSDSGSQPIAVILEGGHIERPGQATPAVLSGNRAYPASGSNAWLIVLSIIVIFTLTALAFSVRGWQQFRRTHTNRSGKAIDP